MSLRGHVFLVGAGPGDPGLLTLRAKELLESADVVVYDRLVSSQILAFAKQSAAMIPVGKRPGHHLVPQEEINALLVRYARAGQMVVRLKGGDPMIFGRGGEEAEVLRACNIPVEIIPGITAAQGAAASLGLPLTQRGVNTSVRYVTGHLRDEADLADLDWEGLADCDTTLVIYMGALSIAHLARKLQAHGRLSSTPAVVIANATLSNQRYEFTDLGQIASVTHYAAFKGPILFIVGEVVGLAAHMRKIERESHEYLSYAAAAFVATG
ncbi:MAG: uroporphyrinogen-III C-methyltransferase [bacterium]|nr:uroporphyrinogen-III C-methyltransferase [bacterium]